MRDYRQKAEEIVRDVLITELGIGEDELDNNPRLYADLGIESIDNIGLTFGIENVLETNFGVEAIIPNGTSPLLYTDEEGRFTPKAMQAIRTDYAHYYNSMTKEERRTFDETRSPKDFENGIRLSGLISRVEKIIQEKERNSKPTTNPSS